MNALLRISGPGLSREVVLDSSGAETTLGRDAAADVQLPDEDKYISRKHLAVWQRGDAVALRVVSLLNGIDTSRGPVLPGQQSTLVDGDFLVLGPYRVEVTLLAGQEAPPAPLPESSADDLFDALLGPNAKVSPAIDPFSRIAPAPPPATSPQTDTSFSKHPSLVGRSGTDGRGPLVGSTHSTPLDDWLNERADLKTVAVSGPPPPGPLDAFLEKPAPSVNRALSPDHVHSIDMPLVLRPVDINVARSSNPSEHASAEVDTGNPAIDAVSAAFGDDPFDDWTDGFAPASGNPASPAFEAQPTNGARKGASIEANPHKVDAWLAFARGLGLPQTRASEEETAEHAGAMVRLLVEGLAELLSARADLKRELRAEDRTVLLDRDNNPLKAKLATSDLLLYLFSATPGAAYMPAARAIRESVAELRVHEHATIAASRAVVEGAFREFEPEQLAAQLLEGKRGLFQTLNNARLWQAYERHYEKQGNQLADWLEAMFSRHFMPTYVLETERLKAWDSVEKRDDPAR